MQGGRGVKIVIFMALRCKVMENTRKTAGAWGKSFSGPPRGPEEQRTYEQARGSTLIGIVLNRVMRSILMWFRINRMRLFRGSYGSHLAESRVKGENDEDDQGGRGVLPAV